MNEGTTITRMSYSLMPYMLSEDVANESKERDSFEPWTVDRARFEVSLALLESARVSL